MESIGTTVLRNMSTSNGKQITTTGMHTGGAPVRIIEDGYPEVGGKTILDKREYVQDYLDHYRRFLMHEPRGHHDMFGVLLVPADLPVADIGAILMDNEGYSNMCGEAVISLSRYMVDKQIIKNPTSPETRVGIQCPCGLVDAYVQYDSESGKTGAVRFTSVPAFVFAKGLKVHVDGFGYINVDIVYGGDFYALVTAQSYGYDLETTPVQKLAAAADATTVALKKILSLEHPESDTLAFLYGTIITDGKDEYSSHPTDNICVFADKQFDRSPCGSGVTARIAQQYHRGHIQIDQKRMFQGPMKYAYVARVVQEVMYGKYENAVIVEVSGRGYYTGSSVFTIEDDDVIGRGFLLQ